jgi:predicted secreted Zn-dependent protease
VKKLFVLLLLAGTVFWYLKPPVHTITLEAAGLSSRATVTSGSREVLAFSIPDTDMEYYDVSGSSAQEIRDNLNKSHSNGGLDGHTGWNVSWGSRGADCTLDTRLRVRLPRWLPPADADPALILHWNTYAGSLARHEQGHVQLARQGFAKMQQTLQGSTCAEADAKLNAVLNEMRQADQRYDAETNHGVTQGAKFP